MELVIELQHFFNLTLTREGVLAPLPSSQPHLARLFRRPQESADGMRQCRVGVRWNE